MEHGGHEYHGRLSSGDENQWHIFNEGPLMIIWQALGLLLNLGSVCFAVRNWRLFIRE